MTQNSSSPHSQDRLVFQVPIVDPLDEVLLPLNTSVPTQRVNVIDGSKQLTFVPWSPPPASITSVPNPRKRTLRSISPPTKKSKNLSEESSLDLPVQSIRSDPLGSVITLTHLNRTPRSKSPSPPSTQETLSPNSSQEEYQLTQSTQELTPPPSPVLTRSVPLQPQVSPPLPTLDFLKPNPTVSSKTGRFSFRSTSMFLTFPRCATQPQVVLDRALEKWGRNVDFAVVSTEKHQDGSPHLHAVFGFKERISGSNARFVDFLSGSHGNVQYVKSISRACKYVAKDGLYVVHGDVPGLSTPQGTSTPQVKPLDDCVAMLKEKRPMKEVFEKHGKQVLLYGGRLDAFAARVKTYDQPPLLTWQGVTHTEISVDDPPSQIVVQWLNENVLQPRKRKQSQLFIVGPPNIGKSYLIETLRKFCRVYDCPMGENWYNQYSDDDFDLVFLEEFRGQKTITWLNQFLDGSPMPLAVKQGGYLKMKNLPVVIASNYTLEECFHNAAEAGSIGLEALRTRLAIADFKDCPAPAVLEQLNESIAPNDLHHPDRRFRMTYSFMGLSGTLGLTEDRT